MANIRINTSKKTGEAISFTVRIFAGYDGRGKQLKPHTKTYPIPRGMASFELDKYMKEKAEEQRARFIDKKATKEELLFRNYAKDVINTRNIKDSTKQAYFNRLEILNNEFGNKQIDEITKKDVLDFHKRLKVLKKGNNKGAYKTSTVNKFMSLLYLIFSEAVYNLDINENPVSNIKKDRNSHGDSLAINKNRMASLEDIVKLLDILEDSDNDIQLRLFVNLLVGTGARKGEILALNWSDVNFDENIITLDETLSWTKERGSYMDSTKTGKGRELHVHEGYFRFLREYKGYWEDAKKKFGRNWKAGDYVFFLMDKHGKATIVYPSWADKKLKKIKETYELNALNPHSFRHAYASISISAGVGVAEVSEALGHSQVATTLRTYTHAVKSINTVSDKVHETISAARNAKSNKNPTNIVENDE